MAGGGIEGADVGGGGGEGGFSLGGLMKMFGALGEEGGIDRVAEMAALKGDPPPLPPEVPPASGIPDFPPIGSAGQLQPGAFANIIDPSIGQTVTPQFGNLGVDIAGGNQLTDALAAAELGGGGNTPPAAEREQAGLTPQQSQVLAALNDRQRTNPLRAVSPPRPGSQVQAAGPFGAPQQRPRLTLAQILGR